MFIHQPFSLFRPYPQLKIALTTRAFGDVLDQKDKLWSQLNASDSNQTALKKIIWTDQIHQTHVHSVDHDSEQSQSNTDGLTTQATHLGIAVYTADCLPIVLFHPKTNQVAVIHAGWRGLARGILPSFIKSVRSNQGWLAAIGPSIHAKDYQVQPDFLADQASFPYPGTPFCHRDQNQMYCDLQAWTHSQMNESGLSNDQIQVHAESTYGQESNWFSHRAFLDRLQPKGRFATVAWLTD